MSLSFERTQSVAIIGGGPGGYEAALAAAQLGAEVTVVERAGIGGSAVITDVVPSKTLIATADAAIAIAGSQLYVAGDAFASFDLRDGTPVPWSPELLGGNVRALEAAEGVVAIGERLARLEQKHGARFAKKEGWDNPALAMPPA